MATVTLQLDSERWLDELLLQKRQTDGGGADFNDLWALPSGLGDVAVIEVLVNCVNFATMVASPELLGAELAVVSADTTTVLDIIGTERWSKISADRLSVYFSPDPLVLVRQGETIRLRTPELDTNATPTADIDLYLKAVRVRPIEGAVRGPLRLVNVTDM